MEPLLLAGYTTVFVALFTYLVYLHRRMQRLENRVVDLRK